MPFQSRIQPINTQVPDEPSRLHLVQPKSLFKRFFDRPYLTVSKNPAADKVSYGEYDSNEFDPSSACLANMIQDFIEGTNNNDRQNDDDMDFFGDSSLSSSIEACEVLKGLVLCSSVHERNLLADTSKIVEKNKVCKRKDGTCMKIVTDGLIALGYDASICKSRWEKSSSYPAGQYQYVDAIIEGERYLIDIDFRSEFEIARSTKTYKSILQTLPYIFVGKPDRLQKIIMVLAEAAKQSLIKKGLHVPPWRKAEYIRAKWLSAYTRAKTSESDVGTIKYQPLVRVNELIKSDWSTRNLKKENSDAKLEIKGEPDGLVSHLAVKDEKPVTIMKEWKWKLPLELKSRSSQTQVKKMVTGLASVIED